MIEFIQNKKRLTQIPQKYALQVVGKQSKGEWNLGGGICISSSGTLMDELECENIWISDVHVGSGIYGSRQVHFFLAFLHTILSATVGAYRRQSPQLSDRRRLSAPVGELSAPDSCGRLSINYCEKGRQGPGL